MGKYGKILDFLAEKGEATLEELREAFPEKKSKCLKRILQYYVSKGYVKLENGKYIFVERKYRMVDKVLKAMRYLRRFTVSEIAKIVGITRQEAGAYCSWLKKAGYIKKVDEIRTKNGRFVVYTIIKDEGETYEDRAEKR
jgi:DNA-binding IclR family transcriptional regulator